MCAVSLSVLPHTLLCSLPRSLLPWLQMDALRRGVDVVVGTPGRVMDLLDRKRLVADKVRFVVLDEADQMLDMGFQEDMEVILQQVCTWVWVFEGSLSETLWVVPGPIALCLTKAAADVHACLPAMLCACARVQLVPIGSFLTCITEAHVHPAVRFLSS